MIRPSASQKISQRRLLHGRPLPLPRPIWVYPDEDPVIAQGRYLLDLEVGFLKDFDELLEPLSRLRPPAVDVSKPNEGQGLPYDLWAEETRPGIQVAPIESIDQFPHDLDVLLRHRLLRQPGGFEGLAPSHEIHLSTLKLTGLNPRMTCVASISIVNAAFSAPWCSCLESLDRPLYHPGSLDIGDLEHLRSST